MIVEKALEKDPAERYQTMRDLVVDLRRMARQKSAVAAPPAAVRGHVRWLRWAVALAFVTAVLGAGAFMLSRRVAVPERARCRIEESRVLREVGRIRCSQPRGLGFSS